MWDCPVVVLIGKYWLEQVVSSVLSTIDSYVAPVFGSVKKLLSSRKGCLLLGSDFVLILDPSFGPSSKLVPFSPLSIFLAPACLCCADQGGGHRIRSGIPSAPRQPHHH